MQGRRAIGGRGLVTIALFTTAAPSAMAAEMGEGAALAEVDPQAVYEEISAPLRPSARGLLGVSVGGGLRFNNPYRLATQLGATAESVSATAPYLMLDAGFVFGRADGLQQGGFLGFSFALTGVSQAVFVPGYMLLYRGPSRWLVYGRGGPAIVLSPDSNVGLEVAGGAAYFLTGGLGVALDVAGDLFYGASTWEKKYPVYPVLSASLGLIVDLELLP